MSLLTRHNLTSAQRKLMPVHRGAVKYFPDALMLVAMLSLRADRKHTPNADPTDMDRPQWVKNTSADHGDCLVRHQMDIGTLDPEMGLDYRVHVAWRGLAQLQAYVDEFGMAHLVDFGGDAPAVVVTEGTVPELNMKDLTEQLGVPERIVFTPGRITPPILTGSRTQPNNNLSPAGDGFDITHEDMVRVSSTRAVEVPSKPVTEAERELASRPWVVQDPDDDDSYELGA